VADAYACFAAVGLLPVVDDDSVPRWVGDPKLGNLCWSTIPTVMLDGRRLAAFSEGMGTRFSGYRWNVLRSPNKQDSNAAHGEPLGEAEGRLAKRGYGWPEDSQFLVPESAYEHFERRVGVSRIQSRRMIAPDGDQTSPLRSSARFNHGTPG
jgi:hypothetical protein